VAAANDQLEVLRMLADNNFNFRAGEDLKNNEGTPPLMQVPPGGSRQHAAAPGLREAQPGDHALPPHAEFRLLRQEQQGLQGRREHPRRTHVPPPPYSFLSNTLIPEEKAFNVLSEEQTAKLTEIYNDIDFDDLKAIDLHKAVRFNKYIQENIPEAKAEKDANDFLKSTAICNKHSVNIDEWIFSFSKLYVCDADEFNKFVEDYDAAVALQGKLKAINI
jgi:hypothetical protein